LECTGVQESFNSTNKLTKWIILQGDTHTHTHRIISQLYTQHICMCVYIVSKWWFIWLPISKQRFALFLHMCFPITHAFIFPHKFSITVSIKLAFTR